MDENIRFIQVLDDLKRQGVINDYVQAASSLGTNKAGISEIKSGRKNLSIELLRRMKKSYQQVSVEWIIMGEGDMYVSNSVNNLSNSDTQMFIDKITHQAEEIGSLKEQIKHLEYELKKHASGVTDSSIANAVWSLLGRDIYNWLIINMIRYTIGD